MTSKKPWRRKWAIQCPCGPSNGKEKKQVASNSTPLFPKHPKSVLPKIINFVTSSPFSIELRAHPKSEKKGHFSVSKEMCMDIAKMRRELKRHAKAKLLFLDETYARIGTCQSRTLVAPGGEAYVVVDDTDAYALRYDMIACCSGERVFPPIIFTPTERKEMGVKGIRKWVHRQHSC